LRRTLVHSVILFNVAESCHVGPGFHITFQSIEKTGETSQAIIT